MTGFFMGSSFFSVWLCQDTGSGAGTLSGTPGALKMALNPQFARTSLPVTAGEKNMTVQALEHVTIRCAQLKRTRDFYVELMGLVEGARPDFPFRGHWLYLGDVPVVHLVEAADNPGAWGRDLVIPSAEDGTGSFDHVAFRGDNFADMRARLTAAGITFRERAVPGGQLSQLFVPDPEGVLVEINFRNRP
jgi:catechol 2,3-dioxygenase-like lactoylglutathione lyase family enzyme